MPIKVETGTLAAGGIAAILASGCCLLPIILVSVGLGGAWMSVLQELAPFHLVFVGAAVVALYFAHRHIYRPAAECQSGEVCALPQTKRTSKILFWVVAALLLIVLVVRHLVPLFL